MGVYIRAKFQDSSIILTSFRQRGEGGVILHTYTPNSKQTSKKPTQIKVKEEPRVVKDAKS